MMNSVILAASDGYPVHTTVFVPAHPASKVLLINSATGVRQHVYFSFAEFFCQQGFTVITYDYRGIGLSKPERLRNFQASMRVWGTHDYRAVTQYIQEKFPDHQKFCLGHSVGALILGMNPDSEIFDEFVFVATQKAFVGNLRWQTRIEAYIGFGILQPLTSKLLGYFPANRLGLGENLPKGSARDWRTLILNRKSTNKLLESVPDGSSKLHQRVFVLNMEDDTWVTNKGVQALLQETYPNLQPKIRKVMVAESDHGKIGHIQFFRSFNRKLWNIVLDELLDS